MSFNNLTNEEKNKIRKNRQKKQEEETRKRKRVSNEIIGELSAIDPHNKLDRDSFVHDLTQAQIKNSRINVRSFLNELKLDEFKKLLKQGMSGDDEKLLVSKLNRGGMTQGFGFFDQKQKKNVKKLDNFYVYRDYLQGRLKVSLENKKMEEKIQKLKKETTDEYQKIKKLNDDDLKKLLEKFIELGVLENLKSKSNTGINPYKSRIDEIIRKLGSCENALMKDILRNLTDIMINKIQNNFDKVKDRVVRKNLLELISSNNKKIKSIPDKKVRNSNNTYNTIVGSPEYYKLELKIKQYKNMLTEVIKIIETSQKRNPFKKKLRGFEKEIYDKSKEAEKIINKLQNVLNQAKGIQPIRTTMGQPFSFRR